MNQERFKVGDAIRRDVVGSARVDNLWKTADDFTRPIYEFITEYCWGELWGRPYLDRRTRSLINICVLAALNRPNELRIHVGGAIRNGVTVEEIRECCLQAMVYAGVPAGLEATNVANETLTEMGVK